MCRPCPGRTEATVRSDGRGVDIHVVQLAGCEAHWMAEGARIAEAQGADIIDINMGCPSKQVTDGASGSALMRDPDHRTRSDRGDGLRGSGSGDLENAAWLGRLDHQARPICARRAEAAGVRSSLQSMDAPRCQFYSGITPIGAQFAPSSRRCRFPLVVNGDIRILRRCSRSFDGLRRRRRHDRARRTGPPVAAWTDCALPGDGRARAERRR